MIWSYGNGRILDLSSEVMESESCGGWGVELFLNCFVLSFMMREVGWEIQRIRRVNFSSLEC